MAANSGIEWVDVTFNWCVKLLYDWAAVFGITYEEINIWIFVVIWPIITVVMAIWIVALIRRNRRLKKLVQR